MPKILVTGSNGQLGSELKELSRVHSGQFTFIDVGEVDLTDEQRVRSYLSGKSFDWIINCAAYTAVDRAEEEEKL